MQCNSRARQQPYLVNFIHPVTSLWGLGEFVERDAFVFQDALDFRPRFFQRCVDVGEQLGVVLAHADRLVEVEWQVLSVGTRALSGMTVSFSSLPRAFT